MLLNLFTSRQILKNPGERWITEYNYGCTHNVFKISIPRSIQGRTYPCMTIDRCFFHSRRYSEVLETLYMHSFAIVIGIEESNPASSSTAPKKPTVRIFPPLDTVLSANMSLIIIGHTGFATADTNPGSSLNSQSITKTGYYLLLFITVNPINFFIGTAEW